MIDAPHEPHIAMILCALSKAFLRSNFDVKKALHLSMMEIFTIFNNSFKLLYTLLFILIAGYSFNSLIDFLLTLYNPAGTFVTFAVTPSSFYRPRNGCIW